MRIWSLVLIICLGIPGISQALEGDVSTVQSQSRADLVSEYLHAIPNQPVGLGLKIQLNENWHTYWKNSGDSGAAPILDFKLPEGVTISEIKYPYPQRMVSGEFTTFGYKDEVLLFREITVGKDFKGQTLPVEIYGEWLVCEEACISQIHTFKTELPVSADKSESEDYPLFQSVRAKLPLSVRDWNIRRDAQGAFALDIAPSPEYAKAQILDFFPYVESGIGNNIGTLMGGENGWRLELSGAGREFRSPFGVLVVRAGDQVKAIEISETASIPYRWVVVLAVGILALFFFIFRRKIILQRKE